MAAQGAAKAKAGRVLTCLTWPDPAVAQKHSSSCTGVTALHGPLTECTLPWLSLRPTEVKAERRGGTRPCVRSRAYKHDSKRLAVSVYK